MDGVEQTVGGSNPDITGVVLFNDTFLVGGGSSTYEAGKNHFCGFIDAVRISRGALSPAGFLPARPGRSLVALYRFDRDRADDVAGRGHALTFDNYDPAATSSWFQADGGGFVTGASAHGLKVNGSNDVSKRQRLFTTEPVDLSYTKALTVEIDYNRYWNPNKAAALAAREDSSLAGGFILKRTSGNNYAAGFRDTDGSGSWASYIAASSSTATNGWHRLRYSIDASSTNGVFALTSDGATTSQTAEIASVGGFGEKRLFLCGDPDGESVFPGFVYRVAISDTVLGPEEYALDSEELNSFSVSTLAPEYVRTLAAWNGSRKGRIAGAARRDGAYAFAGGTEGGATTNLHLYALSQVTVDCFVNFGDTPASGTIFATGDDKTAGSFKVSADAVADSLSGWFLPESGGAAVNGCATSLSPLCDSEWHHVALVIDRTKTGAYAVSLYVDGRQATESAGRAWDGETRFLFAPLRIGGDGFSGLIDDVRVTAGVLAPEAFPSARTDDDGDGLVVVMGGEASQTAPEPGGTPAQGGGRWWRGMVHMHSIWSDGRALPEQGIVSYKDAGYDFVALTDHNRFQDDINRWVPVGEGTDAWPPTTITPACFAAYTNRFGRTAAVYEDGGIVKVRLATYRELKKMFDEPERFLLMPGVEITTDAKATGVTHGMHMNVVGLDDIIARARNASLIESLPNHTVASAMRESREMTDALAASMGTSSYICMVNHPNWVFYDVSAQDIIDNPEIRYFEVCDNGSTPSVPTELGLDPEWYMDEIWDAVLAYRLTNGQQPLYGFASDDSHFFPGTGFDNRYFPFRDGYIMVRADELTQDSLFAAIGRGDFYASSELDLEDVSFDSATGTLSVAVPAMPGVASKIRFIVTKRGTPLDPAGYVDIPASAENGDRPRTVAVYDSGIGATAKLAEGATGEALSASYTLAADDLYVRARIETDAASQYHPDVDCLHPKHHTAWTQPYSR